ncbi:CKLF-like MARVEL transmembrane domain-containing protein 6 [Bagarius yarrelli]|uniref:CKLF-like MARVEL transmembrane domain-containing protein 6 n=1 Tax=Bagarius yarrelli TaxID=175774 RepID=A0A556V7H6_BAGYA|nr:CKLF-like MARVEL transmembrane domain-containing protein 6 [Bagarius yarrelli]
MATPEAVYNSTTTAEPAAGSPRWFPVTNPNLDFTRFCVKILEVLLSFVAFVLEEVVSSCLSCGELYFFEFVSCTAFLFTLLLLILLSTPLHQKVGINCWPKLAFGFLAAFAFLADVIVFYRKKGSPFSTASAEPAVPEVEKLNTSNGTN